MSAPNQAHSALSLFNKMITGNLNRIAPATQSLSGKLAQFKGVRETSDATAIKKLVTTHLLNPSTPASSASTSSPRVAWGSKGAKCADNLKHLLSEIQKQPDWTDEKGAKKTQDTLKLLYTEIITQLIGTIQDGTTAQGGRKTLINDFFKALYTIEGSTVLTNNTFNRSFLVFLMEDAAANTQLGCPVSECVSHKDFMSYVGVVKKLESEAAPTQSDAGLKQNPLALYSMHVPATHLATVQTKLSTAFAAPAANDKDVEYSSRVIALTEGEWGSDTATFMADLDKALGLDTYITGTFGGVPAAITEVDDKFDAVSKVCPFFTSHVSSCMAKSQAIEACIKSKVSHVKILQLLDALVDNGRVDKEVFEKLSVALEGRIDDKEIVKFRITLCHHVCKHANTPASEAKPQLIRIFRELNTVDLQSMQGDLKTLEAKLPPTFLQVAQKACREVRRAKVEEQYIEAVSDLYATKVKPHSEALVTLLGTKQYTSATGTPEVKAVLEEMKAFFVALDTLTEISMEGRSTEELTSAELSQQMQDFKDLKDTFRAFKYFTGPQANPIKILKATVAQIQAAPGAKPPKADKRLVKQLEALIKTMEEAKINTIATLKPKQYTALVSAIDTAFTDKPTTAQVCRHLLGTGKGSSWACVRRKLVEKQGTLDPKKKADAPALKACKKALKAIDTALDVGKRPGRLGKRKDYDAKLADATKVLAQHRVTTAHNTGAESQPTFAYTDGDFSTVLKTIEGALTAHFETNEPQLQAGGEMKLEDFYKALGDVSDAFDSAEISLEGDTLALTDAGRAQIAAIDVTTVTDYDTLMTDLLSSTPAPYLPSTRRKIEEKVRSALTSVGAEIPVTDQATDISKHILRAIYSQDHQLKLQLREKLWATCNTDPNFRTWVSDTVDHDITLNLEDNPDQKLIDTLTTKTKVLTPQQFYGYLREVRARVDVLNANPPLSTENKAKIEALMQALDAYFTQNGTRHEYTSPLIILESMWLYKFCETNAVFTGANPQGFYAMLAAFENVHNNYSTNQWIGSELDADNYGKSYTNLKVVLENQKKKDITANKTELDSQEKVHIAKKKELDESLIAAQKERTTRPAEVKAIEAAKVKVEQTQVRLSAAKQKFEADKKSTPRQLKALEGIRRETKALSTALTAMSKTINAFNTAQYSTAAQHEAVVTKVLAFNQEHPARYLDQVVEYEQAHYEFTQLPTDEPSFEAVKESVLVYIDKLIPLISSGVLSCPATCEQDLATLWSQVDTNPRPVLGTPKPLHLARSLRDFYVALEKKSEEDEMNLSGLKTALNTYIVTWRTSVEALLLKDVFTAPQNKKVPASLNPSLEIQAQSEPSLLGLNLGLVTPTDIQKVRDSLDFETIEGKSIQETYRSIQALKKWVIENNTRLTPSVVHAFTHILDRLSQALSAHYLAGYTVVNRGQMLGSKNGRTFSEDIQTAKRLIETHLSDKLNETLALPTPADWCMAAEAALHQPLPTGHKKANTTSALAKDMEIKDASGDEQAALVSATTAVVLNKVMYDPEGRDTTRVKEGFSQIAQNLKGQQNVDDPTALFRLQEFSLLLPQSGNGPNDGGMERALRSARTTQLKLMAKLLGKLGKIRHEQLTQTRPMAAQDDLKEGFKLLEELATKKDRDEYSTQHYELIRHIMATHVFDYVAYLAKKSNEFTFKVFDLSDCPLAEKGFFDLLKLECDSINQAFHPTKPCVAVSVIEGALVVEVKKIDRTEQERAQHYIAEQKLKVREMRRAKVDVKQAFMQDSLIKQYFPADVKISIPYDEDVCHRTELTENGTAVSTFCKVFGAKPQSVPERVMAFVKDLDSKISRSLTMQGVAKSKIPEERFADRMELFIQIKDIFTDLGVPFTDTESRALNTLNWQVKLMGLIQERIGPIVTKLKGSEDISSEDWGEMRKAIALSKLLTSAVTYQVQDEEELVTKTLDLKVQVGKLLADLERGASAAEVEAKLAEYVELVGREYAAEQAKAEARLQQKAELLAGDSDELISAIKESTVLKPFLSTLKAPSEDGSLTAESAFEALKESEGYNNGQLLVDFLVEILEKKCTGDFKRNYPGFISFIQNSPRLKRALHEDLPLITGFKGLSELEEASLDNLLPSNPEDSIFIALEKALSLGDDKLKPYYLIVEYMCTTPEEGSEEKTAFDAYSDYQHSYFAADDKIRDYNPRTILEKYGTYEGDLPQVKAITAGETLFESLIKAETSPDVYTYNRTGITYDLVDDLREMNHDKTLSEAITKHFRYGKFLKQLQVLNPDAYMIKLTQLANTEQLPTNLRELADCFDLDLSTQLSANVKKYAAVLGLSEDDILSSPALDACLEDVTVNPTIEEPSEADVLAAIKTGTNYNAGQALVDYLVELVEAKCTDDFKTNYPGFLDFLKASEKLKTHLESLTSFAVFKKVAELDNDSLNTLLPENPEASIFRVLGNTLGLDSLLATHLIVEYMGTTPAEDSEKEAFTAYGTYQHKYFADAENSVDYNPRDILVKYGKCPEEGPLVKDLGEYETFFQSLIALEADSLTDENQVERDIEGDLKTASGDQEYALATDITDHELYEDFLAHLSGLKIKEYMLYVHKVGGENKSFDSLEYLEPEFKTNIKDLKRDKEVRALRKTTEQLQLKLDAKAKTNADLQTVKEDPTAFDSEIQTLLDQKYAGDFKTSYPGFITFIQASEVVQKALEKEEDKAHTRTRLSELEDNSLTDLLPEDPSNSDFLELAKAFGIEGPAVYKLIAEYIGKNPGEPTEAEACKAYPAHQFKYFAEADGITAYNPRDILTQYATPSEEIELVKNLDGHNSLYEALIKAEVAESTDREDKPEYNLAKDIGTIKGNTSYQLAESITEDAQYDLFTGELNGISTEVYMLGLHALATTDDSKWTLKSIVKVFGINLEMAELKQRLQLLEDARANSTEESPTSSSEKPTYQLFNETLAEKCTDDFKTNYPGFLDFIKKSEAITTVLDVRNTALVALTNLSELGDKSLTDLLPEDPNNSAFLKLATAFGIEGPAVYKLIAEYIDTNPEEETEAEACKAYPAHQFKYFAAADGITAYNPREILTQYATTSEEIELVTNLDGHNSLYEALIKAEVKESTDREDKPEYNLAEDIGTIKGDTSYQLAASITEDTNYNLFTGELKGISTEEYMIGLHKAAVLEGSELSLETLANAFGIDIDMQQQLLKIKEKISTVDLSKSEASNKSGAYKLLDDLLKRKCTEAFLENFEGALAFIKEHKSVTDILDNLNKSPEAIFNLSKLLDNSLTDLLPEDPNNSAFLKLAKAFGIEGPAVYKLIAEYIGENPGASTEAEACKAYPAHQFKYFAEADGITAYNPREILIRYGTMAETEAVVKDLEEGAPLFESLIKAEVTAFTPSADASPVQRDIEADLKIATANPDFALDQAITGDDKYETVKAQLQTLSMEEYTLGLHKLAIQEPVIKTLDALAQNFGLTLPTVAVVTEEAEDVKEAETTQEDRKGLSEKDYPNAVLLAGKLGIAFEHLVESEEIKTSLTGLKIDKDEDEETTADSVWRALKLTTQYKEGKLSNCLLERILALKCSAQFKQDYPGFLPFIKASEGVTKALVAGITKLDGFDAIVDKAAQCYNSLLPENPKDSVFIQFATDLDLAEGALNPYHLIVEYTSKTQASAKQKEQQAISEYAKIQNVYLAEEAKITEYDPRQIVEKYTTDMKECPLVASVVEGESLFVTLLNTITADGNYTAKEKVVFELEADVSSIRKSEGYKLGEDITGHTSYSSFQEGLQKLSIKEYMLSLHSLAIQAEIPTTIEELAKLFAVELPPVQEPEITQPVQSSEDTTAATETALETRQNGASSSGTRNTEDVSSVLQTSSAEIQALIEKSRSKSPTTTVEKEQLISRLHAISVSSDQEETEIRSQIDFFTAQVGLAKSETQEKFKSFITNRSDKKRTVQIPDLSSDRHAFFTAMSRCINVLSLDSANMQELESQLEGLKKRATGLQQLNLTNAISSCQTSREKGKEHLVVSTTIETRITRYLGGDVKAREVKDFKHLLSQVLTILSNTGSVKLPEVEGGGVSRFPIDLAEPHILCGLCQLLTDIAGLKTPRNATVQKILESSYMLIPKSLGKSDITPARIYQMQALLLGEAHFLDRASTPHIITYDYVSLKKLVSTGTAIPKSNEVIATEFLDGEEHKLVEGLRAEYLELAETLQTDLNVAKSIKGESVRGGADTPTVSELKAVIDNLKRLLSEAETDINETHPLHKALKTAQQSMKQLPYSKAARADLKKFTEIYKLYRDYKESYDNVKTNLTNYFTAVKKENAQTEAIDCLKKMARGEDVNIGGPVSDFEANGDEEFAYFLSSLERWSQQIKESQAEEAKESSIPFEIIQKDIALELEATSVTKQSLQNAVEASKAHVSQLEVARAKTYCEKHLRSLFKEKFELTEFYSTRVEDILSTNSVWWTQLDVQPKLMSKIEALKWLQKQLSDSDQSSIQTLLAVDGNLAVPVEFKSENKLLATELKSMKLNEIIQKAQIIEDIADTIKGTGIENVNGVRLEHDIMSERPLVSDEFLDSLMSLDLREVAQLKTNIKMLKNVDHQIGLNRINFLRCLLYSPRRSESNSQQTLYKLYMASLRKANTSEYLRCTLMCRARAVHSSLQTAEKWMVLLQPDFTYTPPKASMVKIKPKQETWMTLFYKLLNKLSLPSVKTEKGTLDVTGITISRGKGNDLLLDKFPSGGGSTPGKVIKGVIKEELSFTNDQLEEFGYKLKKGQRIRAHKLLVELWDLALAAGVESTRSRSSLHGSVTSGGTGTASLVKID